MNALDGTEVSPADRRERGRNAARAWPADGDQPGTA